MNGKRKLSMVLGAVLMSGIGVVGLASPALASGQYCADGGGFDSCTDVNGAGQVINWASANATSDAADTYCWQTHCGFVANAHVELVSPSGAELCNSSTVAVTGPGIKMSCTWNAGGGTYAKGNYCTVVWDYVNYGTGFVYEVTGVKDCLYVS